MEKKAESVPSHATGFWSLERLAAVGFALALIFVSAMGISAQRSINSLVDNAGEAELANEFLTLLEQAHTDVRAAESNQRGLVLTGDADRYLPGFESADEALATNLNVLLTHKFSLPQKARTNLVEFVAAVHNKMNFARNTVQIFKTAPDEARGRIIRGEGFNLMENIRREFKDIQADVQNVINERTDEARAQAQHTITSSGIWIALDVLLLTAIFFFIRAELKRRRATEHELSEARDIALESTRLKSEFLASMSHEIRTPMNGVIGMTGLLLDSPLSSDQRRLAETVQLSANSLLTIINDILDYSKIEAGRMTFEEMDFDIQTVVESALDLFAHKVHEKGLELVCLIEPSAPKRLRGDAGRLRQILVNLIGNAVKFTTRGEVFVSADRAGEKDGSSIIRFTVRDTGIGIDPKILATLFTPFTQADNSTTRRFGGTGLGLAICKKLVAGMGGEIGADSKPGQGSTFWFTVRMPELPEIAPIRTVPIELTGRTALVVDDNDTNRHIIDRQLRNWGIVPALASSGKEALSLLRDETLRAKVAVAILDLHMPGMDGMELARQLKSNPATAAIPLALLSSGGNESAQTARQAGFAVSLMKPVKQSELYDALNSAVGSIIPVVNEIAPATAPENARKLKILVAEDNRVNQLVATGIIEKLGYRADVVADGEETLEALRRIPYDLILMDCQMPIMDGFEATQHIRKIQIPGGHRTAIVAMTANAMEGDREKCLAAGMDDYLSKPIQRPRLQAILEKISKDKDQASTPPFMDDLYTLDPVPFNELRGLKKRDGTNLLDELIRVFLEDGPKNYQTLSEAMAAGDLPTSAERAHALRGSARLFGARVLSESLESLETSANAGQLEPARQHFLEVTRAFHSMVTQLRAMPPSQ